MLGYVLVRQPTMILHSIKSVMSVRSVILIRMYCFGIKINIRNIRNLMRIYCFGINSLFVTVIILPGWESWYSHWSCYQLLVQTVVGVGVVVTPPFESARVSAEARMRQRERHRDRFGVFSQAKANGRQPCETSFALRCGDVLGDKEYEGRPDQETVAWA